MLHEASWTLVHLQGISFVFPRARTMSFPPPQDGGDPAGTSACHQSSWAPVGTETGSSCLQLVTQRKFPSMSPQGGDSFGCAQFVGACSGLL